ncbi:hypothetical protein [Runella sp. SP2]|uniref:hypothetical protein n=1 Tax=Runella sp. SP2 TaxID=2268026 RepID=UPI000F092CEA|nr:hypothetical protein [Runella sp. SP2]AYQ31572.1 hypothetical protein DTQ70_05005 [Runella sp. SP2]
MNSSTIEGNHNIVIQNVTDSTITLNVSGEIQEIARKLDVFLDLLKNLSEKNFQTADKIYNIGTINNANFDFILKQTNFQGLPNELKEHLLTESGWGLSLKQELISQKIAVRNNRTFEHYGWLIEVFLQKMSTEVGKASTLRALSFMTEAYQASIYYLCMIQLAQLLQQKEAVNITNPIFSDFIKTPPENQALFDYQQLLLLGAEALGANNFVTEITDFVTELQDTENDLYGVALYLDKIRRQLINNQLQENNSLQQLLEEYRTALIFWLRKLVFIARYRLVSMKEINIQYRLGATAKEFIHYYGELHGVYEGAAVDGEDYTTFSVKDFFTYNHSVLLFKGTNIDASLNTLYNNKNYISLSPLIIDQSVFSAKMTQTPEIFNFCGMSGRSYHFAQYKNELPVGEPKTIASNKSFLVKKENLNQPKWNELFEHLELLLKPLI